MVRLSKPGDQAPYVSYIDRIDDEDVLKGLEALKRRAMRVANHPASAEVQGQPAAETRRRNATEIVAPVTPRTTMGRSLLAMDSPVTPKMGPRTRMWGVGTPKTPRTPRTPRTPKSTTRTPKSTTVSSSSKTSVPATPPPIPDAVSKKTGTNGSEFVPKWKLSPRIEPIEIPRWQLETERAVQLAKAKEKEELEAAKGKGVFGRFSRVCSLQRRGSKTELKEESGEEAPSQVASEEQKEPSSSSSVRKFEPVTPPKKKETIALKASDYIIPTRKSKGPTRNLALEQNVPGASRGYSIVKTASDVRRERRRQKRYAPQNEDELDAGCCDDGLTVRGFMKNSERVSFLFDGFGCLGMVDQMIEPNGDFDEEFTYCSATTYGNEEEEGSLAEHRSMRATRVFEDESKDWTESEASAARTLGELEPMVSSLEGYKRFLEQGESEPVQLEYISNLLSVMEGKLQAYGGYRRRVDRREKPTLQTVSQQVDEVNKLLLRVVEDFIDEQLVRATNPEEASVSSASFTLGEDYTVDEASTIGYTVDGASTIGDATATVFKEDDSLVVPQADSFDRDYNPPTVGGSVSPSRNEEGGRESPRDDHDVTSVTSARLAGETKFLSAESFTENDPSIPRQASFCKPPLLEAGKDDKSLRSYNTQPTRTALVKNITRALSFTPSSSKVQGSKEQGVARLDNAIFLASNDEGKSGSRLPPLKPRPRKSSRIITGGAGPALTGIGITPSSSWGGGTGQRTKMKRRNSEGCNTFIHPACGDGNSVLGIEAVADSPESGTSLVIADSQNGAVLVHEAFDGDRALSAIESVMGFAAAPLRHLSITF